MPEESGKYITDKHGRERFVADKSLENLKLGSQARDQGKIKCTFTLLPNTISWLKQGGNASGRIDEMVDKILSGALVNSNSPSPALTDALKKIADLEQALKRSQEQAAELQAEVDRYRDLFIENKAAINKAKFNNISKPLLDKLKKEIEEL